MLPELSRTAKIVHTTDMMGRQRIIYPKPNFPRAAMTLPTKPIEQTLIPVAHPIEFSGVNYRYNISN